MSRSADHHSEYIADHETAVNALDEVTRLAPDHAEAWLHKALALSVLGRAEDALAAHAQVLRLRPDDPEAWLHQAASLRALGFHQDALQALEQTLGRRPADADACFLKMLILGTLARGEEALGACEEVLRLETTDTATRCCEHNLVGLFVDRRACAGIGKGSALARMGRGEDAHASYMDTFRQSRDSLAGPLAPDGFIDALRTFAAARRAFFDLLRETPDEPGVWIRGGSVFARAGRGEEALEANERAIALAPENEFAWWGKAEALVQCGRREEAIAAYEAALGIRPGFLAASMRLGVVLKELGRDPA